MEKVELKKKLFKQVLGAMVSLEFLGLTEEEVITTTEGAIGGFRNAYRSYKK